MSAMLAPLNRATERPRLRSVPSAPPQRMGGLGFVAVVAAILAAGMFGLLVVNTQIQEQGFALAAAQREAAALANERARLRAQLDEVSSTVALQEAAGELGMVPAALSAQLHLRTGEVHGSPVVTTGSDYPTFRTEAQDEAAREARRKRIAAEKAAAAKAAEEKKEREAREKKKPVAKEKQEPAAKDTTESSAAKGQG